MAQRWLRQLGSGSVYHWTETLAKRRDMVEDNEETVQTRIEAEKRSKAEREAAAASGVDGERDALRRLQEKSAELNKLQSENEEAKNLSRKQDEVLNSQDPGALKPDDLVKRDRVMTHQEIEEEEKSRKLGQDKEYQNILVMKTKDALISYMQEAYGIIPSEKAKLEELRVLALTKRAERMFEGK